MRHTHDPAKRTANLKKHGYDFRDAPTVIESDQTVTFEDRRFNYPDQRLIALGMLRGARAAEIVEKWIDFFVLHKSIQPERITKRLK
jgi:uncharacterized DUF497 family protein